MYATYNISKLKIDRVISPKTLIRNNCVLFSYQKEPANLGQNLWPVGALHTHRQTDTQIFPKKRDHYHGFSHFFLQLYQVAVNGLLI